MKKKRNEIKNFNIVKRAKLKYIRKADKIIEGNLI